jgi:hypothetical protein
MMGLKRNVQSKLDDFQGNKAKQSKAKQIRPDDKNFLGGCHGQADHNNK